uniref:N-acetyltransferase domain-containing protein n=1 Tax=Globisporangium ultimum (strain ATCC 200006 / CBS 805.95 / DAOM BR144) TaxID=431595 RepID=K3XAP9_GLOUD
MALSGVQDSEISLVNRIESSMSMSIKIRQFREVDRKCVAQLFVDGFLSYPEHEGPMVEAFVGQSVEGDLASIRDTYILPGGNFWVATTTLTSEHGELEKVIGMVALEKKKPNGDGELRRMAVGAAYRHYGIGKRLVAHLEQWARANKYLSISLTTGEVMIAARRFYRTLGFEQTQKQVISEDPYVAIFHLAKQLQ